MFLVIALTKFQKYARRHHEVLIIFGICGVFASLIWDGIENGSDGIAGASANKTSFLYAIASFFRGRCETLHGLLLAFLAVASSTWAIALPSQYSGMPGLEIAVSILKIMLTGALNSYSMDTIRRQFFSVLSLFQCITKEAKNTSDYEPLVAEIPLYFAERNLRTNAYLFPNMIEHDLNLEDMGLKVSTMVTLRRWIYVRFHCSQLEVKYLNATHGTLHPMENRSRVIFSGGSKTGLLMATDVRLAIDRTTNSKALFLHGITTIINLCSATSSLAFNRSDPLYIQNSRLCYVWIYKAIYFPSILIIPSTLLWFGAVRRRPRLCQMIIFIVSAANVTGWYLCFVNMVLTNAYTLQSFHQTLNELVISIYSASSQSGLLTIAYLPMMLILVIVHLVVVCFLLPIQDSICSWVCCVNYEFELRKTFLAITWTTEDLERPIERLQPAPTRMPQTVGSMLRIASFMSLARLHTKTQSSTDIHGHTGPTTDQPLGSQLSQSMPKEQFLAIPTNYALPVLNRRVSGGKESEQSGLVKPLSADWPSLVPRAEEAGGLKAGHTADLPVQSSPITRPNTTIIATAFDTDEASNEALMKRLMKQPMKQLMRQLMRRWAKATERDSHDVDSDGIWIVKEHATESEHQSADLDTIQAQCRAACQAALEYKEATKTNRGVGQHSESIKQPKFPLSSEPNTILGPSGSDSVLHHTFAWDCSPKTLRWLSPELCFLSQTPAYPAIMPPSSVSSAEKRPQQAQSVLGSKRSSGCSAATASSQATSSSDCSLDGLWQHPLAAAVQIAGTDPDCLAIFTTENGTPERHSYRQLWERSYSIAQGLGALPDWDGDRQTVAILCEAEATWVFCTYALWILGSLKIRHILYHHTAPEPIEGVCAVNVGLFPLLDGVPEPTLTVCKPLSDTIGYLSTSGTIGMPKIYPVRHQFVSSVQGILGHPSGSMGVFQAPSFSLMMGHLVASPNRKGSLWFAKSSPNPIDRIAGIRQLLNHGMEAISTTPSQLRLAASIIQTERRSVAWSCVKRILVAAEVVPVSLLHQARSMFPQSEIVCGYGSSEGYCFCTIRPSESIPRQLLYRPHSPGVRCVLLDESGNAVDARHSRAGILCLAVDKSASVYNTSSFAEADPKDRLSPFGLLPDGSPRVCTMDWVEMVTGTDFMILGRFGQKIKINGVFVDLQAFEDLVSSSLSSVLADCAIVQTADLKIVLIYVPKCPPDSRLTPLFVLEMAETVFALRNMPKLPIHNCFGLRNIPLNGSGKRDLRELGRIAENADRQQLAVSYAALEINDSPLSRISAKVAYLGSRILGIEAISGRNYYVAGVGFDSLSVCRLAFAIKSEYGVKLSPRALLAHGMTPKNIASIIIDICCSKPLYPPTTDLAQEVAQLDDPSISASGLPRFVFRKRPRAILLTKVTCFLGAFLLFELANKFPGAKIICLVQASDEIRAECRIREVARTLVIASRNHQDPRFNIMDRVYGVCGDLSKDRWGLSDARWSQMAELVDVIVHNGAENHWLYDYTVLKNINVLGTTTALRLATTHHLKTIHYISTIGTIPITKGSSKPFEEKMYSSWNISGGYAQTKWVAEQLISKARMRGVPATIIRPSMIAGDSVHGVSDIDSYFWRYIKGCIQLGAAPSHVGVTALAIDPVDHVARVIAEIAASKTALSKFVFHVSDPERSIDSLRPVSTPSISAFTERSLFELVLDFGWDIHFETRDQFREHASQSPAAMDDALIQLMHLVTTASAPISNINTRSIYHVPSPPPSHFIAKCLLFLLRTGLSETTERPEHSAKNQSL
ncbi:male sterility protein-domain-containing protein [Polychytrium aggregatum]|uniref:male sterility protein-domain-containing protein n=1 Tax=Polychytrium aggregatum TaxID=110093 RepID=UPI0022FE3162|nr:male sterility protein-domain-containing protein [Polychytrium aggregatum]KAI9202346.1 male sterility protein-domain-containing protein [Polychytrium aggregatum]